MDYRTYPLMIARGDSYCEIEDEVIASDEDDEKRTSSCEACSGFVFEGITSFCSKCSHQRPHAHGSEMKAGLIILLCLASVVIAREDVKCYSHAPIRSLFDAPTVPGFSTAFSQKGLDYVKTVGIDILKKRLPTLEVPEVNGTTKVAFISVYYEVKNLHFKDIEFGSSDITIVAGKGVQVNIKDSKAEGSLDWHWQQQSFPHLHGTGSATFSLSLSLSLFFQFEAEKDHLQLEPIPATVDISDLTVRVDATGGWFYNTLLWLLEGIIKGQVSSALETAFPSTITGDINQALMQIPVRQQIVHPVVFDIGLVRQPLFADSVFRFYEAGDSYDENNIQPCPKEECPVVELPSELTASRMVQMYMSDFVPSSLARAFLLSGLLQYRVTPDMVPPTFPFQLTTKVLAAICPRLAKFYPDNKAELIVNVTSTPKVRFVEGRGVDVTIDGVLSVLVLNDTQWIEALAIENVIHADATVKLGGWSVYGQISNFTMTAAVIRSTIGRVDIEPVHASIQFILDYLLPAANVILKTGIRLPAVPGFSIAQSDIFYGPGYLSLGLDLAYNAAAFLPKVTDRFVLNHSTWLAKSLNVPAIHMDRTVKWRTATDGFVVAMTKRERKKMNSVDELTRSRLREHREVFERYERDCLAKVQKLEERTQQYKEQQREREERLAQVPAQILLNVGGQVVKAAKSTLLKRESLLSEMLSSGKWQADKEGRLFLDRDADKFDRVLDYLQSDKELRMTEEESEELEFLWLYSEEGRIKMEDTERAQTTERGLDMQYRETEKMMTVVQKMEKETERREQKRRQAEEYIEELRET
ncbi:bactericidal permeability-increasing protein-like, partial [Planoprotostelium fungivorum]